MNCLIDFVSYNIQKGYQIDSKQLPNQPTNYNKKDSKQQKSSHIRSSTFGRFALPRSFDNVIANTPAILHRFWFVSIWGAFWESGEDPRTIVFRRFSLWPPLGFSGTALIPKIRPRHKQIKYETTQTIARIHKIQILQPATNTILK